MWFSLGLAASASPKCTAPYLFIPLSAKKDTMHRVHNITCFGWNWNIYLSGSGWCARSIAQGADLSVCPRCNGNGYVRVRHIGHIALVMCTLVT